MVEVTPQELRIMRGVPPKVGEWRPIETAPKDGTSILVVEHDGDIHLARYAEPDPGWMHEWQARDEDHGYRASWETSELSHWTPLPKPPND
jgi:hypothetical protein